MSTRTLPAWCEGSRAEPLIHGSTYFDVLATEIEALRAGDYVFFTDWRGDPDQKMREGGPTIAEVFCRAAERGVVVKGLMWRSHLDKFAYSEQENQHLGDAIEQAGGEVLLDQRVRLRRFPSPEVRGVTASGQPGTGRRVRRWHRSVPFPARRRFPQRGPRRRCRWRKPMAIIRPGTTYSFGCRARWSVRSDGAFRERWNDPARLDTLSPIAWIEDKLRGADLEPGELPAQPPDPPQCGPHAVQVLRTYPRRAFRRTTSRRTASAASPGATARRSAGPAG